MLKSGHSCCFLLDPTCRLAKIARQRYRCVCRSRVGHHWFCNFDRSSLYRTIYRRLWFTMRVQRIAGDRTTFQTATDCEQVSVETTSQRNWARHGTCGKILTVDEVMILPILWSWEKAISKWSASLRSGIFVGWRFRSLVSENLAGRFIKRWGWPCIRFIFNLAAINFRLQWGN